MFGEEKILNAGTFSEPGGTHDAIGSKNGFWYRNELSITYSYYGEYDSRNIGLVRWCSINEAATLIGSRY